MKVGKKNKKGKIPDFLVQDGNALWHVFESKGGNSSNRWPQLIAGLEQLVNVSSVGATHQTPVAPATTVCVQTLLEFEKPISIVLVDPPTGGNGATDNNESVPTLSLVFVPGVAEMMAAVESLDWYHGLSEQRPVVMEAEDNYWQFSRTTAFGGLLLGVPRQLLELEPQLRDDLNRYIAVQRTLERINFYESFEEAPCKVAELPQNRIIFHALFRSVVGAIKFGREVAPQADDVYAQINNATSVDALRTHGALYAWSLHLNLGRWIAALDDMNAAAKQSLGINNGLDLLGAEAQVTEGGLYLRLDNR